MTLSLPLAQTWTTVAQRLGASFWSWRSTLQTTTISCERVQWCLRHKLHVPILIGSRLERFEYGWSTAWPSRVGLDGCDYIYLHVTHLLFFVICTAHDFKWPRWLLFWLLNSRLRVTTLFVFLIGPWRHMMFWDWLTTSCELCDWSTTSCELCDWSTTSCELMIGPRPLVSLWSVHDLMWACDWSTTPCELYDWLTTSCEHLIYDYDWFSTWTAYLIGSLLLTSTDLGGLFCMGLSWFGWDWLGLVGIG